MEQNKYITQFKDYNELPFSEKINKALFDYHSHAEIEYEANPDAIVYTEKDVLILMQMLMDELKPAEIKVEEPIVLSKQHEVFVDEFFKNGMNATQAYLVAYPGSTYDNANAHACRLVVNGGIQLAIQKKYAELQQRNQISIDEIISELKNILETSKGDSDNRTALKALDQLSKIIGGYAPKQIENINAAPIQINIIKPE